MKRRWWWIYGAAPLGALVGWGSGQAGLPDWIAALAIIVVTLLVCGLLWRYERRFTARMNEALAKLPRPSDDA